MTDMQVPVRLRREPGMNPAVVFVCFYVLIDDLSDEILGDLLSRLHVPHTHLTAPTRFELVSRDPESLVLTAALRGYELVLSTPEVKMFHI